MSLIGGLNEKMNINVLPQQKFHLPPTPPRRLPPRGHASPVEMLTSERSPPRMSERQTSAPALLRDGAPLIRQWGGRRKHRVLDRLSPTNRTAPSRKGNGRSRAIVIDQWAQEAVHYRRRPSQVSGLTLYENFVLVQGLDFSAV